MGSQQGHPSVVAGGASPIDYFVLPTTFGTSRARTDLLGSGITCPPFRDYSERPASFMKTHPEVGSAAMT